MSEPSYRLIVPQANRSFIFKYEAFDLANRWHYHPEVELMFFIEGKTRGVMGEGFQHFEENDLVLLGANFPHVLQESTEYSRMYPDCKPFGLVIQFTEDFMGTDFFLKPEMQSIRQMIKKAQRGLSFKKDSLCTAKDLLLKMPALSEPRKFIALIEVLQILAEAEDYSYMTPKNYFYDYSHDEDRMRSVNQYVYDHFTDKITIRDVASVANMTETSFCRYFKTRCNKNFSRFLNEVRISYACKLLKKSNYSVTEVSFQSGFNELSYFTRQFKRIMGVPPQQYRMSMKELS
ncbi:MAG: helix-turn-helix transcriptional regulator [Chitinophagaceae bacterium]|nr:helix-turn-helix transcriptional regulator [Chitinophagaceae bacterium]